MRLRWIATIIVAILVVMAAIMVYSVSTRARVDDFNSDNPTDPDNPVTPNEPTPPSQPILPVASGTFTRLYVSLSVVRAIHPGSIVTVTVDKYGAMPSGGKIDVFPYTGTSDPVFEWIQYHPASVTTGTFNLKYWLVMNVIAQFPSTVYHYGVSASNIFTASWTSSVATADITWSEGQYGSVTVSHTWQTGNIYYWEHGTYAVRATVCYELWNEGVLLTSSLTGVDWWSTFEV